MKALLLTMALLPFTAIAEEDPFDALDRLLEERFERVDRSLEEQYQLMDEALEAGYQRLANEVAASWGEGETKLPSKKEWVDYSRDLKTRRLIDFELGVVTLERLISPDDEVEQIISELNSAAQSIATDSVSMLAEKDLSIAYAREALDSLGIELSRPVRSSPDAVLKDVIEPLQAARIKSLVTKALRETDIDKRPGPAAKDPRRGPAPSSSVKNIGGNKKKITIKIPMNADYSEKLSGKYYSEIIREASKRKLPASLLFAVMETESSFNPRARSVVPAFGLMQLVPRSGAMDAYEFIHGDKVLLGPEYLFQSDNNVELGAAYLSILHTRYLRHISDPLAREYCVIAAYNTGAGNVARSFIGTNNIRKAAEIINKMSPAEVYDHLREKLPHEETRRYIVKVTRAKKKYEAYDSHTPGPAGI